ncbi:hypothetical protein G6O67_001904 [Ophiocordyceps sinensis]|uniref:Cytochrome P450 n=2 Tax=Ophiocordyceps sinensis TaxID=72228 RepID=A0A8H4V6N2_9HYPO|nr:hypothetical protein G6O67_001904 [Ophiocordyceps sinensis]
MSQPIPQPPGVPVLGNIFNINQANPWASLKSLAEQHGEIFQIRVLNHSIVFVASVALADEICDERRFRKFVGGPVVEIRHAVGDSLFSAYHHEESWGIAHRIIAPSLQPDAVARWFPEMRDTASELLALWKTTTGPVSPFVDLGRLDLETVTLILFGKRLNRLSGPVHPMIQGIEHSTNEAVLRPNRPAILNWLVYGGKFASAIAAMRTYAADLVKTRKETPTQRQDLLEALLYSKDPETNKALTDSQVLDEVVTMPIASGTQPCLLASALCLLLQNPKVIVKARQELDAVIGDGEFTYAHLAQLDYVQAIIRESLRLSFPAPGFNIEPIPSADKSPVLLAQGKYQIPHDQPMIIVMAGVNRDPAVFEDPLSFKPERMMGEAFDRLPPGAKKWFGSGKRECTGKHYAWQWCTIIMAKMLREMDFEMADPDYKLEHDGWFNVRPIDFTVNVSPREKGP